MHLIGVFDSSPYVWGPWSKLLDKKWYQWYWISICLEPTPNIRQLKGIIKGAGIIMFGCLHNCENWELYTIENECFSPGAFLKSIMSTCPTISSRYIPNMSSQPHIELFFEENSKQDLIPAAYFGWICCFSYGILNRISQKCWNFTVTEQMPTCLILGLHLLNFYV